MASCNTVLRRIQRLPLRKCATTSWQYLPGVWKQEWQPLWHKLFQELWVSSVLVSPSFHFNSTTLLIILPKHRSDGLPLSSTLSDTSQAGICVLTFLCPILYPPLQAFGPSAAAKLNYSFVPKHSLHLPVSSSLPRTYDPLLFCLSLQAWTHSSFLSWDFSWFPHLSGFSPTSASLWYIITCWYKPAVVMMGCCLRTRSPAFSYWACLLFSLSAQVTFLSPCPRLEAQCRQELHLYPALLPSSLYSIWQSLLYDGIGLNCHQQLL